MENLISFISDNLKTQRLEEISTSVINAYKNEDDFILKTYAGALHIIPAAGERRSLFYKIIQRLHPDRLSVLKDEFESAKAKGDKASLERLKLLLEIKINAEQVKTERFEYEHNESWESAPIENYDEFGDDLDVFEEDSFEAGFIGAVQHAIFGNHDFHVEPADLGQIDGGLDICFCGLDELEGIKYCHNVRSLNIAGNNITNIFDLQYLTQLEEFYAADNSICDIDALSELESLEIIDLSGNDVEDISPLLKISSLKFADLRHNPIANRDIIETLEASGIIILR